MDDLPEKIKRKFSQALTVLVLLYRCTPCILDWNYVIMLRDILNESWKERSHNSNYLLPI